MSAPRDEDCECPEEILVDDFHCPVHAHITLNELNRQRAVEYERGRNAGLAKALIIAHDHGDRAEKWNLEEQVQASMNIEGEIREELFPDRYAPGRFDIDVARAIANHDQK